MRSWRAASLAPIQGYVRFLDGATKVYFRGECCKDVWMSNGGVVQLSWRFLVRFVLALVSSGISILLMWEKSSIGRTIVLISHTETSCIISTLMMCPLRFYMLAELEGEFLIDSTYSESPFLPPKLAADVTSLSGLAGGLGDAFLPSVSRA